MSTKAGTLKGKIRETSRYAEKYPANLPKKKEITINRKEFIETYFKITTKDRELVNLKFNPMQNKLYEVIKKKIQRNEPIRLIVLKARQLGCSTVVESFCSSEAMLVPNTEIGIITHRADATNNLFNMSKRFYNYLPDEMKPELIGNNGREIIFNNKNGTGLNSRISVMTASDSGVGRSKTYNGLHISEYAFWNCAEGANTVLTGLLSCVPKTPRTFVIIESTANGYNDFYELWNKAEENGFEKLFFAWFMGEDYAMDYPQDEFLRNPLTEYEENLLEKYPDDVDLRKIYWRRYTIKTECLGDERKFRQEYPSTPDEAFIVQNECPFDLERIQTRMNQIYGIQPLKVGDFDYELSPNGEPINISFVERKTGNIKIYQPPMQNRPYFIGGDTAGSGSDFFVGQVIDNKTCEQVATFCRQTNEDEYARQMYCLGMYYNMAMISVENNINPITNYYLDKWEYPFLHIFQTKATYGSDVSKSFGFKTTRLTKSSLIAILKSYIRDNCELINDYRTLQELSKYQRVFNKNSESYGAMDGEHDDHVMALGIALISREDLQYPTDVIPAEAYSNVETHIPFALRDNQVTPLRDTGDYYELWD